MTLTSVASNPTPMTAGSTYSVTLTGTGFAAGVAVSVDGAGGTINSATQSGSTTITLNFTAGVAGAHTFTVTNTDTGAASKTFTVNPAPTYLAPNITGLGMSGSTVNISGTNFRSPPTVTVTGPGINNQPFASTFVSSTQVNFTATTTPQQGATYTVTLTNPDGQFDSYSLKIP